MAKKGQQFNKHYSDELIYIVVNEYINHKGSYQMLAQKYNITSCLQDNGILIINCAYTSKQLDKAMLNDIKQDIKKWITFCYPLLLFN